LGIDDNRGYFIYFFLKDEDLEFSEAGPSSAKKPKFQTTLDKHFIATSKAEKEDIDIAIAEFFYSTNTPFLRVNHPTFLAMVNKLRPGYKPPNRKELSESLLEIVYEKSEKGIAAEFTAETNDDLAITLQQDGWSSVRNDPIIGSSVSFNGRNYVVAANDAGSSSKTAEFCADDAKTCMDSIRKAYNKEVFAICTDNEAKMRLMRTILSKEYPDLITYGDPAHFLNLLEKEITPEPLLKHVVEIQKHFKYKHKAHGLLKMLKGAEPQLPNETRWSSKTACLKSYTANYGIYCQIVRDHSDKIELAIAKKINNLGIYHSACDMIIQLDVLEKSMVALQKEALNLGEVFYIWKNLVANEKLEAHTEAIQRRMDMVIEDFHYLVFLTHPKYRNLDLCDSEEQEKAENWLRTKNPEFLRYYFAWRIQDNDVFPKNMFVNEIFTLPAIKYWQTMKMRCKSGNDEGRYLIFNFIF
jgi:Protein of unknown function (DUF 659)